MQVESVWASSSDLATPFGHPVSHPIAVAGTAPPCFDLPMSRCQSSGGLLPGGGALLVLQGPERLQRPCIISWLGQVGVARKKGTTGQVRVLHSWLLMPKTCLAVAPGVQVHSSLAKPVRLLHQPWSALCQGCLPRLWRVLGRRLTLHLVHGHPGRPRSHPTSRFRPALVVPKRTSVSQDLPSGPSKAASRPRRAGAGLG